jgi:uncharacterized protein (DUF1810 family)
MSLDRFKTGQDSPDSGFTTALTEMQAGRKTSHWIWYIFPQLVGLGRSSTAKFYGLRDGDEALAYLHDSVLGPRLAEITHAVADELARGAQLNELMGGTTDAQKIVSSLTLFEWAVNQRDKAGSVTHVDSLARDCAAVLDAAERQGYSRCQYTLTQVGETDQRRS